MENLFGAYDAIAERRGVYKIETIGDSYVAVCGLPEPRKVRTLSFPIIAMPSYSFSTVSKQDHAVVMAKFAAEVRSTTIELTKELEEILGEGTSALSMRIGLHSGPTVAGVLRGQRARYQVSFAVASCRWIQDATALPHTIC